jgi:hypothetical protein
VSFTPEHYSLLDRIARERRRGFSEALRCIVDYALDTDASLGLPFHHDRQKALQGELATVEAMIEELKTNVADVPKVFEQVTNSVNTVVGANPKPSYVDKRPGLTEEERFLKAVPYAANDDKMVTPELKRKVLDQARVHSEWLAKIHEPERSKLEAMLRGGVT